ncbi:MAG: carotenoid oxygenase family protein [Solirubrobacteraceae bacterium]|nr:carotenoid oxygenase family protein [Solirubrobacteraceae bacterium]
MVPSTPTATTAAPGRAERSSAAQRSSSELGFTDQRTEITVEALPVEGEVPSWLTGSLLRNGPAQWDLQTGSVNHWFDGMAMLHRFAFSEGKVSYRNKLLRGKAATAYERDGKLSYREFASDPCKSTFGRVMSLFDPSLTDNGAVNITQVAGKWVAITESPMGVEFDPRTLETIGVYQRAKGSRVPLAHEHVDRATGEIYGVRTLLGRKCAYELTATERTTGVERLIARIPVKHPAYQHSFALTERFVVVGEHPFVVDPLRLLLSGKPFIENFRWEPQHGTTFTAVDRRTGEVAGTWTAPASFCFHHVNAFDDEDGSVVVELCAFDDASIVHALALQERRDGAAIPESTLRRYRLPRGGGDVVVETTAPASMELPRIDDRFARAPHRFVWGVGLGGEDASFLDRLVLADVQQGEVREWHEPGVYPGEPVFVPRPGGTEEGDGVVLSVLLEPALGASSLLVLDAISMQEVARVRVPQHIPFGFHGGFVKSLA